MANRVASCPQAKQIVGQKNWTGWPGSFAFAGFKGNWVGGSGGSWTDSADGGAVGGGEPNFAVGDLVLVETAAIGPVTDYLTGLSQSYPKTWRVYICTAAISGSATDPALDGTHFTLWDFQVFNVTGGSLVTDAGEPGGGPTAWPIGMGGRAVSAVSTDTAQLELTITTELDNFPLYPATISGLTAAIGASNDTAAAFADATVQEASASGTFAYDWTFANNYDGTAATYTPPGTAPSAEQAHYIFPALPLNRPVGYQPNGHYDGDIYVTDSVFIIDASPPAVYIPFLVSWSFSSSSISFEFAAWSYEPDVEWSLALGHFGDLATAPGTITQTLTLGGASYTLADVAAQATALMGATTFDSIAWGTSWTNTYDTSGAVVSTQNFADTAANSITAGCAIGAPVKWGAAVNNFPYSFSKALVDVCGNYCQRTYNCPTVTCVSGNVDGFAPVEIDPPGTTGESAGIYANCTCT